MSDLAEQTELLARHEGFLMGHARHWARMNPHVSLEDLMQEGRLALLQAHARHDGRGSLLTFATWPVRRAMRNHVMAFEQPMRLSRHYFSHVNQIATRCQRLALDEPLSNDREATRADLLVMPEPEEELCQMSDVMALVEAAMLKLKPQQQAVLKARYLDGRKLREVATDHGVSKERIRQIEHTALRLLRSNRNLKRA